MSGKKTIFIIIVFTVIALILTWIWLQYVIEKFDIDRAINTGNQMITSIKKDHHWYNFL